MLRFINIRKLRKSGTFLVAVIIAAIVGGLSTNFVRASIPDSDGTIHSCYSTARGSLYIIDNSSQSCNTGETSLNWDQQDARIFSDRVSIPYDSGSNQLILDVPGYGNFKVNNCSSIDPEDSGSVKFTNTSGGALEYGGIGLSGDPYTVLADNDNVILHISGGPGAISLGKGDGSGSSVAHGTIAGLDDGDNGCRYNMSISVP